MNTFIREYLNKEEKIVEIIHTEKNYARRTNNILLRNSDGGDKRDNIYAPPSAEDNKKIEHDWREESIRRAKKQLKFLILNNTTSAWRFVTLTYAGAGKQDKANAVRDIQKMIGRLEHFLCHDVKYIAVKEMHHTRHGIHFHLLMNIPYFKNEFFQEHFWKKGFVKIEKLKKTLKNFTLVGVYRYIKKYMTKDSDDTQKFEKRYFASRNLIREPDKYIKILEENELDKLLQYLYRHGARQMEAWKIEVENGNEIEGFLWIFPREKEKQKKLLSFVRNFWGRLPNEGQEVKINF